MEIVTTDVPAKLAGTHISTRINQHNGDVVCLLSGGSALDIIEFIIAPVEKSECRTIFIMGDERGSRDAEINNSLQLVTRYPDHYVTHNLILTVPELAENLENFTSRISTTFAAEISNLKNPTFLQVLGVGSDGHTAGIFPLPLELFTTTYEQDDLDIAPVHLEALRIDSRASFTPNWILTKPDELIAYVVGACKQNILQALIQETKEIHERPAELIKRHTRSTLYTDQRIEPN
jgi:6-phosphogluconolactonase/glucosamine-6-phosphate isomerase/deaminase